MIPSPYAFYVPLSPSPGVQSLTPPPIALTEQETHERRFIAGAFDDVLPIQETEANTQQSTPSGPSTPTKTPQRGVRPISRRSRARFPWPQGISEADRLLVAFRCLQQAGFDGLGDFIAAALRKQKWEKKHSPVTQFVANFLQCRSLDKQTHPIAIVDAMYSDDRSRKRYDTESRPIQFELPRYALPPSLRLLATLPPSPTGTYSTHDAFLNWALQRMIERWREEADALIDPVHGLVRITRRGETPTWSQMLSFSISKHQETIATVAPAIFAGITTVSVNSEVQEKLEAAATGLSQTNSRNPSVGQEQAEDEEDQPEALPSRGVPSDVKRDPWQGSIIVILVLLYFKYRFAIIFPTFVGLFLYTCNVHRDVFSFLCRIGLSIHYSTVLNILNNLASDSSEHLIKLGAACALSQPLFLLLFDNINKMQRAWRKVLGHSDTIANGTAATVIGLEDVTYDAMQSAPLLENVRARKRQNLSLEQLLKDIDWGHIRGVGGATVLGVWAKSVDSLRKHQSAAAELLTVKHAKHRLRERRSVIRTMRTTNVDESQTTGVAAELSNLISDQMQIAGHWLNCWLVMVCGDQLSIDRIRKLKIYTAKTDNAFDRHDYALPILQLWHLKWNWQKAIFRLHWYQPTGKGIFGLHHDVDLLQRSKFNPIKCDFYPAHHILDDRFDSLILHILRILCEERTGIIHPACVTLLEGLELYFQDGGPMANTTFDELLDLANLAYRRYIGNSAYEDAQGIWPRDPNIHGPPTPVQANEPLVLPPAGDAAVDDPMEEVEELDAPDEPDTVDADNGDPRDNWNDENERPARKKRKTRASKAKAAEAKNINGNDQCFSTTVNFLRMTFLYMEMCSAVAGGDIGRVFEVIKVLQFSFWGAGSTNYGNELLELACNFLYEFPPELMEAVLNNYLVNTLGLPGHWLELDLLQEHHNFWIKRLFNSKSQDFDSKHLSEAVSLNIHGFSELRKSFPETFGLKPNSGIHAKSDTSSDINALGFHYQADNILRYIPGRNGHVVPNEFIVGRQILAGGKLAEFLERTTDPSKSRQVHPEMDNSEDDSDEDRFPANPIMLTSSGARHLDAFSVGDMW
ncbi:unnamed protein product [Mycena citricolor]|uniref:DUF6589 domain-containing protein n=1 Tax=Mycena citricolor TaxID=2018698 RepID=A0AAD2HCB3_9AGAR|nr:unnamed protein product [Mycena citricolor]